MQRSDQPTFRSKAERAREQDLQGQYRALSPQLAAATIHNRPVQQPRPQQQMGSEPSYE